MASPSGKTLHVVVVTPEKAVLDEAADMVVLPMFDGEFGVLPGRAPVIGRLGAGELRLKSGAATRRFFVEAGFVQIRADTVTVLTAKAVPAEAVTPAEVDKAVAAADAIAGASAVERANKAKARDRVTGMKKVAAKNAATA